MKVAFATLALVASLISPLSAHAQLRSTPPNCGYSTCQAGQQCFKLSSNMSVCGPSGSVVCDLRVCGVGEQCFTLATRAKVCGAAGAAVCDDRVCGKGQQCVPSGKIRTCR